MENVVHAVSFHLAHLHCRHAEAAWWFSTAAVIARSATGVSTGRVVFCAPLSFSSKSTERVLHCMQLLAWHRSVPSSSGPISQGRSAG
jgi:hypothetical protein